MLDLYVTVVVVFTVVVDRAVVGVVPIDALMMEASGMDPELLNRGHRVLHHCQAGESLM